MGSHFQDVIKGFTTVTHTFGGLEVSGKIVANFKTVIESGETGRKNLTPVIFQPVSIYTYIDTGLTGFKNLISEKFIWTHIFATGISRLNNRFETHLLEDLLLV